MYKQKSILMDGAAMDRTLMRISHEIIERCEGECILLGIHRRGLPLAEQLAANIERVSGTKVPVAALDVTAFRDDVPDRSQAAAANPGLPVAGKTVILVDDVIYTGRTVRAAIEALFRHGRPASVQLAVLVDRGHRELPFRPDYVGKNVPTAREEIVDVHLTAIDGDTGVYLL